MTAQGCVFIVDDAREIRAALTCMFNVAGYQVRAFESAERFLAEQDCEVPGCVLIDMGLPGMNGIDLQRALVGSRSTRPVIFLTGRGDIKTSVQAMKMGAVDFLTKPVDDARLFAAVDQALRLDAEQRLERAICTTIHRRLGTLTPRERQVLEQVIRGRLNKQIAADLGITEKTIKVHRERVMRKTGARSVPDLVRLGARVGIEPKVLATGEPVAGTASGKHAPFDARGRHVSPAIGRTDPGMFV